MKVPSHSSKQGYIPEEHQKIMSLNIDTVTTVAYQEKIFDYAKIEEF